VLSKRGACFAILAGLTLAVFWTSLGTLFRFSSQAEHYSHIVLIPAISTFLLIRDRRRIFASVETGWAAGCGLLVAGALFAWFVHGRSAWPSENDRLSTVMFSVVLIWIGGFVWCYGLRAFRAGLFPLLFLFLMVPLPDVILNHAIVWLQTGSAEVTDAMFRMAGVPVFRTGFTFALPGLTIEIAKECSGIRSSLALLIIALLAGHLFLRSPWRLAVLTLAALPLLVVKNGMRIVTLSLLSIYVDPGFLAGRLHQDGGVLFFLLALLMLAPVLHLLQRSEKALGLDPRRQARVPSSGQLTIPGKE
jgi:exosortase